MMNTLKLVYKGNPAKVKDYTFTALRRMVRVESKKNAAGESGGSIA